VPQGFKGIINPVRRTVVVQRKFKFFECHREMIT
jgi:hypothetical protein